MQLLSVSGMKQDRQLLNAFKHDAKTLFRVHQPFMAMLSEERIHVRSFREAEDTHNKVVWQSCPK